MRDPEELVFSKTEIDGGPLRGHLLQLSSNGLQIRDRPRPWEDFDPKEFRLEASKEGVTFTGNLHIQFHYELQAFAKALSDAWVAHDELNRTGGRLLRKPVTE